jgi:NAD(P)-dependent dehydrogenase (short-subunit alcohol dehydrogenase family)
LDIRGKTAIVTGARSGLGAGAAAALRAAGATVFGFDVSAGEEAGGMRHIQVDIADAEAVERAVAAVMAETGRLDIAVNCAGVSSAKRTISKGRMFPVEEWDRVIATNLTGTFNVVRAAALAMARQDGDGPAGGVIINVGSVAADHGQVGQAAYAASKGGVMGLTLPLARDLAPYGIRVMTINPGLFDTAMAAGLPHVVDAMLERMILNPRRLGRPEEFGALVRHIAENDYLNATTIELHAGICPT